MERKHKEPTSGRPYCGEMGGERQGQVSQAPWEATGGLRAEGRRVPPYPLLWGQGRCSFTEEEMEAQGHIPGEWCS